MNQPDISTAGGRIRYIRIAKCMTLKDLARRANVTANHMGLVERGEKPVCNGLLKRVSNALDVSSKWLLFGGDDMKPYSPNTVRHAQTPTNIASVLRTLDVKKLRQDIKQLDQLLKVVDPNPADPSEQFLQMKNDRMWGPATGTMRASDEENIICVIAIDGYESPNPEEKPKVIANVILTRHGDVITDWHIDSFRNDSTAKSLVQDAKAHLCAVWKNAQRLLR